MVTSRKPFNDLIPRAITIFFLGTIVTVTYFFMPHMLSLLLAACLCIMVWHEWARLGDWWLTPLYPVAPFIFLILLNESPERPLLLFVFLYSGLFDCAGYFVGSLYGQHKLAPYLSPRKTWEGLIAGFVTLWLSLPLLTKLFSLHALGWWRLPFVITYGTLAISGDLIVSFFKRRAGVKDSSNLLPGHGGLLDRFASYLLTGVFIYALKNYLIA